MMWKEADFLNSCQVFLPRSIAYIGRGAWWHILRLALVCALACTISHLSPTWAQEEPEETPEWGEVSQQAVDPVGGLWQSEAPAWRFYARPAESRGLVCDYRAYLAGLALGVIGVPSTVYRVFPTLDPVPIVPPDYGADLPATGPLVPPESSRPDITVPNTGANDYVSGFGSDNRAKWRETAVPLAAEQLAFAGNAFEGCLAVPDNSPDDGLHWYTLLPVSDFANARDLLDWFATECPQWWYRYTYDPANGRYYSSYLEEGPAPPVGLLPPIPHILGGPSDI